ncbi:MAG TPA: hypothetical protein VHS59_13530 [Bacillota bacterium]|nr:hypothetical protein [Bacillota bacterium]
MKNDLRCTCKKLFCQIEGDKVLVKCRHCKKIVVIHTRGLISMEFKVSDPVVKTSVS